jgi:nucleoside-diphosphate-sugar epimerase
LRVLIAGCGYVGSALAQRLAADGAQVFGLARRPVGLPPGVEPLAADLGDPATLEALPEGLELVFYAASSDARDPAAYERAYVLGVSNLLARLASYQTPRRFFLVSSTSVYGAAGVLSDAAPVLPRLEHQRLRPTPGRVGG